MKREDWRKAYIPPRELEKCVEAALDRLEDAPRIRRISPRAVALAAAVLLALCSAAYAAVHLGWYQYFAERWGVQIPQAAEKEMKADWVWQVGPATVTCQQLITDGHIAMSSARVRLTDETSALLAYDTGIEETMDDASAERYGLEPGFTWRTAARQMNLSLYAARVLLEPDGEYDGGVSMEDAMWDESGAVVSFHMSLLKRNQAEKTLPCILYMWVCRFDPQTGKPLEEWERSERVELPLTPLLAEKEYHPQESAALGPYTVQRVYAKLYATGAYVTLEVTDHSRQNAGNLDAIQCYDEDGKTLPMGMNLSSEWNTDNRPTVTLEWMYSLNELPARLMLTDGVNSLFVE